MVDPTFLVIGAATFFIVLILILRSGAKEEPLKPTLSKKDKQKQKQQLAKQQKPKKGVRGALKKNERSGIASEWQVVDSASKDATEVLEFLKGKDPNELAKQQAGGTKQGAKKKGKKAKEEVQSSEDSATDDGSLEGFEQVKKKAPADKKKKKKEKKQEEVKEAVPKPYFRLLNPDGTPIKDEKPKKGERKGRGDGERREPRIPREGGDAEGQGERKGRPEGEKRERRPRPEGEQREPRERKDGEEERKPREPRPPKEPREVRRPITSPPNVKYEEADLNDILNSITQDYKPKTSRASSIFSKIERTILVKILSKLEARDLVALSRVNHHLMILARKDSLWKDLLFRDFGVKDFVKYKTPRAAYKVEHKKKYNKGGKKDETAVPQGEEKDAKAKNQKKAQGSKEEVAQE